MIFCFDVRAYALSPHLLFCYWLRAEALM